MMNCLEFRRRVGAEPFAEDAAVDAHRRECTPCTRHQDELRAMDGLIQRALEVNPPPRESAAAPAPPRAWRPRLFAIAASLVAGVAVALVVLVAAPRAAIAREVVNHVLHEPGATGGTAPLSPAAVAAVLDPSGMRLRDGAGSVSFAARCVFDGQVVPHLVVQRPEGPVTVLVLAHRSVTRPVRFSEQGYAGVVLPAPQGAIAVVGKDVAGLDAVAQQVFDAVDWGK
jgi:Protein of unknown function (DUF3379)